MRPLVQHPNHCTRSNSTNNIRWMPRRFGYREKYFMSHSEVTLCSSTSSKSYAAVTPVIYTMKNLRRMRSNSPMMSKKLPSRPNAKRGQWGSSSGIVVNRTVTGVDNPYHPPDRPHPRRLGHMSMIWLTTLSMAQILMMLMAHTTTTIMLQGHHGHFPSLTMTHMLNQPV
jgi:hypothetical protein